MPVRCYWCGQVFASLERYLDVHSNKICTPGYQPNGDMDMEDIILFNKVNDSELSRHVHNPRYNIIVVDNVQVSRRRNEL